MSRQVGVLVDRRAGVVRVLLDEPPVNALSVEMLEDLLDVLETCQEARAIVLASALEQRFSAGADLKHLQRCDERAFDDYLDLLGGVLDTVAALDVPSIAAVDGTAFGGGMELALACDLRVSSSRAAFGLPEVTLGLIPGAGGTQRLTRLAGPAFAVDLLLTGRTITGIEAYRCGLVQYLDESPLDIADQIAELLAERPASANAALKRCVRAAQPPLDGSLRVERAEILHLFGTPGGRDGIIQFLRDRQVVSP